MKKKLPLILAGAGVGVIILAFVLSSVLQDTDPIVDLTRTGEYNIYDVTIRSKDWKDTKVYVKAGKSIWGANPNVILKVGNEVSDSIIFRPKTSGYIFIRKRTNANPDTELKVEQ
ncbi:MAG: hypothetical protein AABO41_05965 [Acidobacteriota bacterium]